MTVPSWGSDETYAWLGMFPQLREWIGPRHVNSLKAHGFTIKNRKFESTISVKREDIADDKLGVFKPLVAEMVKGQAPPDELIFDLLKSGFDTAGFDGASFFAADHEEGHRERREDHHLDRFINFRRISCRCSGMRIAAGSRSSSMKPIAPNRASTADSMARVLADGEMTEEERELDETEQALIELQQLRGPQSNLSYLAFTATPKNVTMERFGRRGDRGPEPFHLYSMRQAVEEGFILDVLRNYQTYTSYAKLEKAMEDDPRLLERKSARKVARFIDFHETAMSQKAEVIVEHFRRHALPELGGQAKAMVVTSSREHAVRTYQAISAYIEAERYTNVRALVAFSGEVRVDGHGYTEPGINDFAETELLRQFDETPIMSWS